MTTTKLKWRDVLKVHPSAEVFPALSAEEFKKLKDSIRKQGLLTKVSVWTAPDGEDYLLDGRGRLDAIEALGRLDELVFSSATRQKYNSIHVLHMLGDVDVGQYVSAANITRRHLTPKQRVELARKARDAARRFGSGTQTGEASPVSSRGGRGRKGEATQIAEDTGLDRKTTRKYIKEMDAEVEAAEAKEAGLIAKDEPKATTPKEKSPKVTTLPTSDAHARDALKLLKKIDPDTLSEKGLKDLDRAVERIAEINDLKEAIT